jgi:hypothetical protein
MNTRSQHQTHWATTRSVLVGVGLAAVLGLTACTDETDTSTVISDGSVVSSTVTTVDGGSDTPQVNVVGTPAPFTIDMSR